MALAALAALAFVLPVPVGVPVFYVVVSVATYVAYAVDKAAARAGRRRVPERVLHLLGVAGGWPGALIAQQFLRHKTRKLSFQVWFWITVLVNVGLVAGVVVLRDAPPWL